MNSKEKMIQKLEEAMRIEEANNFPNGDLWNSMANELDELKKIPSIFEILGDILRSPKDF